MKFQLGIVVHAFNFITAAEAGDLCELKASLIYWASSRKARATQKDISILSQKPK